ncbi:MAG: chitinase N-terminal domain-containing protein [Aeromonadaceae bacterium]
MLSPKPTLLTLLVGCLCSTSALAAIPAKPSIGSGNALFAIFEVNQSATAYEQLTNVKEPGKASVWTNVGR